VNPLWNVRVTSENSGRLIDLPPGLQHGNEVLRSSRIRSQNAYTRGVMSNMITADFKRLRCRGMIIWKCFDEMRVQFGQMTLCMRPAVFRVNLKERTRHQSDQDGNNPQEGGSGSHTQAGILYRQPCIPLHY
jgi:hypothetical protein